MLFTNSFQKSQFASHKKLFCEKIPSHEMNQFLFAIYYFFVITTTYLLASTYSINSKRVEGTEVVHL